MSALPTLIFEDLVLTRDYLRDLGVVMSRLQRLYLEPHPRQWEHGLEVTMRGFSTQTLKISSGENRLLLDLVKHKLRIGGSNWRLDDYSPPELLKNINVWLESHKIGQKIERPEFRRSAYSRDQATSYAEALWWFDHQLKLTKVDLIEGVTSPVLLYPHHFDLALSWFPWDDERQFTLGWSTGDENIAEPYAYLTAYPELKRYQDLELPGEAFWQTTGFSGAIMPYTALQSAEDPAALFHRFALDTMLAGRDLFDQST
jgi:hypothetical protein